MASRNPEEAAQQPSRRTHNGWSEIPWMSDPINIRDLAAGITVVLLSGAEAEIIDNPKDGVWLFARYLVCPDDPDRIGQEEMIFAQDVVDTKP